MGNVVDERGVFWWFQEAHGNTASLEASVPGRLTISEEGHIQLQLDGSLWLENPDAGSPWETSRWLPTEKQITGRLGDYGGSGYVLLLHLLRTDFSFEYDKPIRQSYEAALCFKNTAPFPDDFNLSNFHEMRIQLKGLKEWLQLSSIHTDFDFRDKEHSEFKVSHKDYNFEYDIPDAKMCIENQVLGLPVFKLSDRPQSKVKIREINWIIYKPSEQSTLNELRSAFLRIEELISLLVGQYFRLDWPYFTFAKGEFEDWCQLYSFRGAKTEKPHYSMFWVTFSDLHSTFGDLLNHWRTNVANFGAGYELYTASMQNPIPHPEHEFVNLVWAVESLHRNWERAKEESASVSGCKKKIEEIIAKFDDPIDKELRKWLKGKLKYACEPTLEQRIIEAFSRLPFHIDSAQLRSFAERCAKRRNDISHEGGRRPGEDAESFRAEIQELAQALRYLYHGLLLHEIGINSITLLKAMTRSVVAEMRILPSLANVGIDLPRAHSEAE